MMLERNVAVVLLGVILVLGAVVLIAGAAVVVGVLLGAVE